MQFKLFYLPAQGEQKLEEELNRFIRSHKVIEVNKQLIEGSQPGWCFCITYILSGNVSSSGSPKVNYESILSKEEFFRFERLREHRKKTAQELNIPAYAVFTNKELADLAKKETITKAELIALPGFGKGRMEKIGTHFLKNLS